MSKIAVSNARRQEILHFILHLRWHYQVFILSGGFLLGGYFSEHINWLIFWVQFANVHLLLFGGATVYNSYCDKDEGPVGGLKHPPPVRRWMWSASLLLQFAGLAAALFAGLYFSLIYVVSLLLFWLYSSPRVRWKSYSILSLLAIGLSTGAASLLMGYFAAGSKSINAQILAASLGAALMVTALYPISQLYQLDEDAKRGDETFAIKFGFIGVIRFFRFSFAAGLILLALTIGWQRWGIFAGFLLTGIGSGWWINSQLLRLKGKRSDYPKVMRIKYVTSLAFLSFILSLLFYKHL